MPRQSKEIVHKLGDKHFLNGVECIIKFVNIGIGFAFPTVDDEDTPYICTHICYAKLYPDGKIVYVSPNIT